MLLMAADRVDVVESALEGAFKGEPDNPLSETGLIAEFKHHGIRSRAFRKRGDLNHQWMDPLIVAAPWVLAGFLAYRAGKALAGAARGSEDRPHFTRPG
jgi:hypothetical protein